MIVIMNHTVGFIVETKGVEFLNSLYPKAVARETKKGVKYFIVIEDETISNNSEDQQPATN